MWNRSVWAALSGSWSSLLAYRETPGTPRQAKFRCCVSTRAVVVKAFRQTSDREEDSMQESLWPGWTAGNVNIHWKCLVDTSKRRVVHAKDAATDAASAHCDNYFGFRHRLMCLQKRALHVPRYRAGDQAHVCMTRGGNELDSEALDIVDRIVQSDDLQFASIA